MKMYAFSMFLRGFHCYAMKFSEGKHIPKYIQMHTFAYILGMRRYKYYLCYECAEKHY